MSRKIYLASSWRNEKQPGVLAVLRAAGHEVYDFRNPAPGISGFSWTECGHGDAKTIPSYLGALKSDHAKQGFALDKAALEWCDTCILLLPCGRSAHLELGYAAGQGKDTYVLLANEQPSKTIVIPLTRGQEAIVDERDGHLAEHEWYAVPSGSTWYAARSVGPQGAQKTVFMHRAIMEAPEGLDVDHRDGNGLNNRRSNMRLATRSQNNQNNHTIRGEVGYRGVFLDTKLKNKYCARIRHLGGRKYLGSFAAPEEAAVAYDRAAIELHGEFASLNFPTERQSFTPELMYLLNTAVCTNLQDILDHMQYVPSAVPSLWHEQAGGHAHFGLAGHSKRLIREAVELCLVAGCSEYDVLQAVDLEVRRQSGKGETSFVEEEIADVAILLDVIAAYSGVSVHEVRAEKMKTVLERNWEPDHEGVLWRPK